MMFVGDVELLFVVVMFFRRNSSFILLATPREIRFRVVLRWGGHI